jgi:hypothetical protein
LASVFLSPIGLCLICFGVYAPYFVLFAGNDWVKSPKTRPSPKPCFHCTHFRNVTIWASLCGSRVFRFKCFLCDGRSFTNSQHCRATCQPTRHKTNSQSLTKLSSIQGEIFR